MPILPTGVTALSGRPMTKRPDNIEELNALARKLSPKYLQQYDSDAMEELNAVLRKFNLERNAPKDLESAIRRLNVVLDHVRGQHDDDYIQRFLNETIERINYAANRGGWSDEIRDHFRGHPQLSGSQILDLGKRPDIGHNQGPELDD